MKGGCIDKYFMYLSYKKLMVLITGGNGQLGYDFQRLFSQLRVEYIATDVKELDVTDIHKIREFVHGKNITCIINCAAYNNVDKAEDELELCQKLNTDAARDLAIIAKEIGAEYMTYSTDFVFDGKKKTPYTEEDIPNPLSVYGKTKYEGEQEVLRVNPSSFVVRTSWVFGTANNNFNKQVIEWSQNKDELSVVDDQISSPTYSRDLAYFTWKLLQIKKYGLYHFSNTGEASKYDQAKYVLEKIGWKGILHQAKTSDFILKARRAEYTKLDSSKLEKVVGERIPSWQSGIDQFLKEME
ncbi:dTDP-4-dehydrorhamnose reductase [Fusobacterium necrophorum]|nr:dTDP-4-dehydrorhamnose reductase [Fusobacterium necrophorum]MBR8823957.1 dTDP-4-dehydrorhamnose reductase [Fusobacterium necrophorum]